MLLQHGTLFVRGILGGGYGLFSALMNQDRAAAQGGAGTGQCRGAGSGNLQKAPGFEFRQLLEHSAPHGKDHAPRRDRGIAGFMDLVDTGTNGTVDSQGQPAVGYLRFQQEFTSPLGAGFGSNGRGVEGATILGTRAVEREGCAAPVRPEDAELGGDGVQMGFAKEVDPKGGAAGWAGEQFPIHDLESPGAPGVGLIPLKKTTIDPRDGLSGGGIEGLDLICEGAQAEGTAPCMAGKNRETGAGTVNFDDVDGQGNRFHHCVFVGEAFGG